MIEQHVCLITLHGMLYATDISTIGCLLTHIYYIIIVIIIIIVIVIIILLAFTTHLRVLASSVLRYRHHTQ